MYISMPKTMIVGNQNFCISFLQNIMLFIHILSNNQYVFSKSIIEQLIVCLKHTFTWPFHFRAKDTYNNSVVSNYLTEVHNFIIIPMIIVPVFFPINNILQSK